MARAEQNDEERPPDGVQFTDRDLQDAARLLEMIASLTKHDKGQAVRRAKPEEPAGMTDPEALVAKARRHLRDRELRKQFLSRATFGEPAWEMLLVLYIQQFSDKRLTIGRLADLVDTPLSTAQRWIAYLQKERLIDKEGHPADRRMAYVTLLDKGRAVLDEYFARVAD